MSKTPFVIETIDLEKTYTMGVDNSVRALNSVNIHIQAGEFISIMGPSGSGKSTLMNILGCLDQPTQGVYLLDGEDVSTFDKERLAGIRNQKIGFVFQSYNLLARTSALQNVMLPILYDRNSTKTSVEQAEMAKEVLEAVGLADRADHLPQELSGGESQRVAIARALVNDPVMLLADEPTGNLDSKTGAEIMELLHQLHERGRTILIVTHESEIARQTQRTIFLRDGQIENGAKALAA